jgi:hypothetical protein
MAHGVINALESMMIIFGVIGVSKTILLRIYLNSGRKITASFVDLYK